MMRNTVSLFFTAAMVAGSAIQAHAASSEDTPPVARVAYRDLDLSTPSGVAKLRTRLEQAANEVCRNAGFRPDSIFKNVVENKRCRQTALDKVRPTALAVIARASNLATTVVAIDLAVR